MKIACKVEGFRWHKCPDILFETNVAYEIDNDLAKELLSFPFIYSLEEGKEKIERLLGGSLAKTKGD